jgi:hypothetical protein
MRARRKTAIKRVQEGTKPGIEKERPSPVGGEPL